jgi:hypothetical protein
MSQGRVALRPKTASTDEVITGKTDVSLIRNLGS